MNCSLETKQENHGLENEFLVFVRMLKEYIGGSTEVELD